MAGLVNIITISVLKKKKCFDDGSSYNVKDYYYYNYALSTSTHKYGILTHFFLLLLFSDGGMLFRKIL